MLLACAEGREGELMLTESGMMMVGRFFTSRLVLAPIMLMAVWAADSVTPAAWRSEYAVGSMEQDDWCWWW